MRLSWRLIRPPPQKNEQLPTRGGDFSLPACVNAKNQNKNSASKMLKGNKVIREVLFTYYTFMEAEKR